MEPVTQPVARSITRAITRPAAVTPTIVLSNRTIAEDADPGDTVGAFSVAHGSGSYNFALLDDAGGLFVIDGDLLKVDGTLSPGNVQIEIEADNGVDDPITRVFTITVTALPVALAISGTPVTTATEGAPYTGFTVSAIGGTSPYTFSVASGSLPPGITLNGTTGEVSGTPSEAGTFSNIVIRVTDAALDTDDLAPFAIEVDAAVETLTLSGTPVTTAVEGEAYAGFTLSASGGVPPYAYSTTGGALPDGITVNPSTGEVSGTPTESGTFANIVFRVTDDASDTDDLSPVTITVQPAVTELTIFGTPVTTATEGVAYAGFTVSADGGTPPYVFSVASGAFPDSITLDPDTGEVSGTPTEDGVFANIVLRVTDDATDTNDLAAFTITVAAASEDDIIDTILAGIDEGEVKRLNDLDAQPNGINNSAIVWPRTRAQFDYDTAWASGGDSQVEIDMYSANDRKIVAFSGGAFDSRRKKLLIWGGGHVATGDNSLKEFNLATGLWEDNLVNGPTRYAHSSTCADPGAVIGPGSADFWPYPNAEGERGPIQTHSMGGVLYIPGETAEDDRLWCHGSHSWKHASTYGGGFWMRKLHTGVDVWEPGFFLGNGAFETAVYDPATGKVWTHAGEVGSRWVVGAETAASLNYAGHTAGNFPGVAVPDPATGVLCMMKRASSTQLRLFPRIFADDGTRARIARLENISGTDPSGQTPNESGGHNGAVVDPVTKIAYWWWGTQYIYPLNTQTYTWLSRITLAEVDGSWDVPSAGGHSGIWGKMQFVVGDAGSRGLLMCNHANGHVFIAKVGPAALGVAKAIRRADRETVPIGVISANFPVSIFPAIGHGGVPPHTYTLHEGSLPTGLSLDADTGALSGTPTEGGVFDDIVIRVTDGASNTADSDPIELDISPPGFVVDSLTDTDDTAITSHTGETGATWTNHPSFTTGGLSIVGNALRKAADTTSRQVYASGEAAGADMGVECDVHKYGGTHGTDVFGVAARLSTSANTCYWFAWQQGFTRFLLSRRVAGSGTTVLTDTQSNWPTFDIRNLRMEVVTADASTVNVKCWVNGTLLFNYNDTAGNRITDAGRFGVNWGGGNGAWELDNLKAYDL